MPARRGGRGRSGRRRAGGRPAAMPGPWSRTVSSPSRRRTSTVAPGGLQLAALSSRFATARSSRPRSPVTTHDSSSVANVTPGACRSARSTAAATSSSSRSGSTGSPVGSPSRASSTRSPTSSVSSSSWATRSARRRSRSPAGSLRREPSTSRLVRSDVSGVRSSCDASATSCRCARWESSSASSIVLNDAASRASSSPPVASIRRDRSRVRATCSAVSGQVGHRTHGMSGGEPARGTPPARSRRPRPGRARAAASRARRRPRSRGRATCIAVPSPRLPGKDAHVRAVDGRRR